MHVLLVKITDSLWKQVFQSFAENSYDKCMQEVLKLPDDVSWMIVMIKRQHSGVEKF